jgi:hypothetical protein
MSARPAPVVALAATLAACAPDRGPVFTLAGAGGGLRGEYFAGRSYDVGRIALTRVDPGVDFAWGDGAPDPGLPVDGFQVRWYGFLQPPESAAYTFHTRSDDGVRLWVDERPLIDDWTDHLPMDDTAPAALMLAAGVPVPIKLDYYEGLRSASIELRWSRPGQADALVPASVLSPPVDGHGLTATYFTDRDLQVPKLTRVDLDLELDWGLGSPDPAIPSNGFSARWTGTVEPRYSESYTFYVQRKETNEGVRLTVDGQKLIDDWGAPRVTEGSGTVALVAGRRTPIVLEYYDDVGAAGVELRWSSARQPKTIVSWHRLRP